MAVGRDELIELRRELHRNPELSSHEAETASLMDGWFARLSPDEVLQNLGGHGRAYVFHGDAPGPTVMLRCELDALPIAEVNDFPHRSRKPAVSHKCGHDGHMAILAAVGAELARRPRRRGRVVLLYQPAEETGEGAVRVLQDERFARIAPDIVFALHNVPHFPMGEIVLRHGTFSSACVGLVARLHGRTTHAAYPEHGVSPVGAMSEILAALSVLPSHPALRDIHALVTVTHASAGEVSFGVAPGLAVIMAVLRAHSDEDLARVEQLAARTVQDAGAAHGLCCALGWKERFRATACDRGSVEIVRAVARSRGLTVTELPQPMSWCEDFSELTARYPGALFGLGSGESQPQLHNADYDFPDELIETGAAMFLGIVDEVLERTR